MSVLKSCTLVFCQKSEVQTGWVHLDILQVYPFRHVPSGVVGVVAEILLGIVDVLLEFSDQSLFRVFDLENLLTPKNSCLNLIHITARI